MTLLARNVMVGAASFQKGTDHTAMPPWAVDRIRDPKNWAGGVVPVLSHPAQEQPVSLDGLTPTQIKEKLGITSGGSGGGDLLNITKSPYSVNKVGGADVAAAFQAAATALGAAGGGKLYAPAGQYLFTSTVIALPGNVTLCGDGAATEFLQGIWPTAAGGVTTGGTSLFSVTGSLGSKLACSAVAAAATTITGISSTAGLAVGDLVLLTSQDVYWSGYSTRYKGEYARVAAVNSASQITLHGVTRDAYTTSPGVYKLSPTSNVTLRDFAIRNLEPAAGHATSMIGLKYARNVRVRDLTLIGSDYAGVKVTSCYDVTVTGSSMRDFTDNVGTGQYGYGVMAELATEMLTVDSNSFARLRHAFTTDGVSGQNGAPHNITVTNNRATEMSNTAFDTHQIGSGIKISGNNANGCKNAGYTIRSLDTEVTFNKASWCATGIAVYGVSDGIGNGAVVEANTIRHCWSDDGIQLYDADGALIKSNVIDSCAGAGIYVVGNAQRATIVENDISNTGYVSASRRAGIEWATGVTSTGHLVEKNRFRNLAGGVLGETATTGHMNYAIKNPSAGVTGSKFIGNTAVGMEAGVISDAGGNLDQGNLDFAYPVASLSDGGHNAPGRAESFPRYAASGSITLTSGTVLFGYLTPGVDISATSILLVAGAAASATLTLGRVGLYSVDSSGNLTLVQGSASNTGLLSTIGGLYTEAITAAAAGRGRRFAVGVLTVGTTGGSLRGAAGSSGLSGLTPKMAAALTAQSDLPASVPVGSLVASANVPWFALA